ncbi:UDP-N-acetylmuramate dehydrogenase [Brachybacterium endophyticum]|uniref:UDP-N-acetylenolpyruvoylglucosamine reductase n=1 Tax=Brachybacterium endophyticum TaxID=2182385 RepID=A0A2U2RGX7_9MICO|nr:UDP-N-acetylmuramate dehydrogenase [Brachybacterium endophyticum]PWH05025.1 UDP-N-acetylmuramate dehydrogenase [Brachybacterium endophyticum]
MKLAELTTLRVGGAIQDLVVAREEQQAIEAIRAADEAGRPLLVLGGGSNFLPSDQPFEGTVVLMTDPGDAPVLDATCDVDGAGTPATPSVTTAEAVGESPAGPSSAGDVDLTPLDASCGGATAEYFAGVSWDRAVAYAVAREMIGIEALSGIPGSVGATPIQNVGAYGQEVSATITRVRTWDREKGAVRTFYAADCEFGYRDSLFKRTRYQGAAPSPTGRYVVLSVSFQHRVGEMSEPIRYGQLAQYLGVEVGERVPMARVRQAVLEIRASKGMVLDPSDHDTWSAGSFFTNPILPIEQAQQLPDDAPRFPAGEGLVKSSAAWLISHAGFDKGFSVGPRASLSTKHSLALTNRGDASADDLAELARAVRDGVEKSFGVRLEPEPVRWGVDI